MINANELRLGNKILYTNRMGKSEIVECNCYHLADLSGQTDEAKPELKERYSGIPLTPEILYKIGFKQGKLKGVASFDEYGDDKNEYTYYWDFDVKESEYVDRFSMSLVKWGKKQEYFTFSFQNLRVRFKYLHQLQNLYFSLTGQELIYNPIKEKV